MNRYGRAARYAYDPACVVDYIDHLALQPTPEWTDDYHGRTLRRWRSVAQGVTPSALDNFLAPWYGAGTVVSRFEIYVKQNGIVGHVLRDYNGGTR